MSQLGFVFCICPDSGLIHDYIREFQADADYKKILEHKHTFWGDDELPAAFWEDLTLQGLFKTRKILVLRRAEQVPAATWKKISIALGRPNDQCLPFFCLEVAFDKGQPKLPAHISKLKCLDYAIKNKWIWQSPGLDERKMAAHIKARAAALGLKPAPGVVEILCEAVPRDASAVENELNKIALAAKDGVISMDLAMQAGYQPESNIFSFINMIETGNVAGAWLEIKRAQKDADGLLFPFLSLLLREARTLWQLACGETPYLHPASAGLKKRLASKLGHEGVRRLFDLIMDAELSVKAGRKQPDQALEILVADLILLFR